MGKKKNKVRESHLSPKDAVQQIVTSSRPHRNQYSQAWLKALPLSPSSEDTSWNEILPFQGQDSKDLRLASVNCIFIFHDRLKHCYDELLRRMQGLYAWVDSELSLPAYTDLYERIRGSQSNDNTLISAIWGPAQLMFGQAQHGQLESTILEESLANCLPPPKHNSTLREETERQLSDCLLQYALLSALAPRYLNQVRQEKPSDDDTGICERWCLLESSYQKLLAAVKSSATKHEKIMKEISVKLDADAAKKKKSQVQKQERERIIYNITGYDTYQALRQDYPEATETRFQWFKWLLKCFAVLRRYVVRAAQFAWLEHVYTITAKQDDNQEKRLTRLGALLLIKQQLDHEKQGFWRSWQPSMLLEIINDHVKKLRGDMQSLSDFDDMITPDDAHMQHKAFSVLRKRLSRGDDLPSPQRHTWILRPVVWMFSPGYFELTQENLDRVLPQANQNSKHQPPGN